MEDLDAVLNFAGTQPCVVTRTGVAWSTQPEVLHSLVYSQLWHQFLSLTSNQNLQTQHDYEEMITRNMLFGVLFD